MNADSGRLHAPPNAAALIGSLRALGYSLPAAVADLADNSVTAEAMNVRVEFNTDRRSGWVAVIDDGRGMTEDELHWAMHWGTDGPLEPRHPADLGRFGLGLKTASFSQAKRLTVVTGTGPGSPSVRTWDIDHVRQTGDWYMTDDFDAEAAQIAEQVAVPRRGTMVLWRGLDRCPTGQALATAMGKVREHLGAVFSVLLRSGSLRMMVGGNEVAPWDPFFTMDEATQDLGTETLELDGSVSVIPYILPHPSRILARDASRAEGPSGWDRHQGFFVYRGNRLITLGGWLGLPGLRRTHATQLARIAVFVNTDKDHEWQVDVRKASVRAPEHLRARLTEIATNARNRSELVFRHRGTTNRAGGKTGRELTFVWQQQSRRGRTGYRINRDHPVVAAALAQTPEVVAPLLALVEEAVPVGLIAADAATRPDQTQQAPLEGANRSEIVSLLRAAAASLPSHQETREALLASLASTEPFNRFPDLLEEILDYRSASS